MPLATVDAANLTAGHLLPLLTMSPPSAHHHRYQPPLRSVSRRHRHQPRLPSPVTLCHFPTSNVAAAVGQRLPIFATSDSSLCFAITDGPSNAVHLRANWPSTLQPGPPSSSWKWSLLVPNSKLSISDGFWEDPDDGCDSENEDGFDKEDEETKKHEEVDDKGGAGAEALKEFDLLLSAEEKAILRLTDVPDLSKISTKKWNPLHTLALAGQIPIMDKLLECGAHIDDIDKDGFTVLHKAVIGKKEPVISHLLRKGANPHIKDQDGATSLHYAVQVGAIQSVKLLIKYKVDINSADNDGWTPLHLAIQSRSRDIAKILLINGADKTRRNKDGISPLDISLCFGRDFKSYELAKLLKLVPADA